MQKKIGLSTPHMGGEELKYIQQAVDSNWIAPKGQNIDAFENSLELYFGKHKKVAALNSGTAALHVALILAGVQKEDEVLCQSFTFVATANPILYVGAIPVFVDSEYDTWNMCPLFLESAIIDRISKGKKPKAVVVMHSYGMPAKMNEIVAICKKYDIILIEDAASALGSTLNNQKCGTFGDFGIVSFNGNKIITTSGGGALICKNEEYKNKAIFLATQARDTAPHYQHSETGYNYRMSNVLAGIGRGQLEVLENHITNRRAMHSFYADFFADIKSVFLLEEPSKAFYSNYWLSTIVVESYEMREALRLHLEKVKIESRPLWKPMHLQPVFENSPYYGAKVSEDLFERGLCLPSGSNLTDDDRDRIKNSLLEFFK